jgi:hypothetical protein
MTAQHTPGPWLTQQHCAIVPLPANTYTRIYAHRPGQEGITIGYKVLGQSEDRLLQHASHRVECPNVRPGYKLRIVGAWNDSVRHTRRRLVYIAPFREAHREPSRSLASAVMTKAPAQQLAKPQPIEVPRS